MGMPERQLANIWRAVEHWINENHLTIHLFSLRMAGMKDPYPPSRVAEGIGNGSEPISSEFLHNAVWVFGLTTARERGSDDHLTDEECIGLLTAPLTQDTE